MKRKRRTTVNIAYQSKKAFAVFDTLRRQKLLCDVVLVANGTEVPAHRVILAGCSPYFNAMFTHFKEKTKERIEIKEIDPGALESLVEFVYTCQILVCEENVQTLFLAASLLQFSAVIDVCCDFLEKQLHPTNCLSIKTFANLHGCSNLAIACDTYVENCFSEVVEEEEFLSLPTCRVIEIIKSDKLNIHTEDSVFHCIMNWISQDVENRQTFLPSLMEHVRLPFASRACLLKVSEEKLLQNSEYVSEARKFLGVRPNERVAKQTLPAKPRQHQNKVLFALGNYGSDINVECYDLVEQEWYATSDIPSQRERIGLTVHGNQVYVLGGNDDSSALKTVDIYNVETNEWNTGIPMIAKRSKLGVAVLNDKIYAIGGYDIDNENIWKSAEVFDLKTKQWSEIAPMLSARRGLGVAILNNRIYAVGGCDDTYHNTVEYYNPATNTWHKVARMAYRRNGVGVAVMDGILYAVGGSYGSTVHNSVEAYDPNTNIWREVAKMNVRRKNAGVVSFNKILYAIGGCNGTESLSSVEVYCARNDKWTILPKSLSMKRNFVGVVLLDMPPNL